MRGKITAFLMIALLIAGSMIPLSVAAYQIPKTFWSLNESYNTAWENEEYADSAYYGAKIIDLILKEPANDTTADIIGSRSYNVAFSYYFIGDYENAVKYFEIYLPYGIENNWTEGVKIAREFIRHLTARLDVYQITKEEQTYFGAKCEPHGILYGQVSEETKDGESMVLLYLTYGKKDEFDWAKCILDQAVAEKKAVEVALNFVGEGTDIKHICRYGTGEYIDALYRLLFNYPTIPLYFRIGAEMNIWTDPTTPDQFITVFRSIADRFHQLPNVAMVWSVGHTGRWASEEWPYQTDDFYPGDRYVDWVGLSAYMNQYFNGEKLEGIDQFNEVCFKTGDNADPVIMLEELVQTYGDRKPIMMAEGGSAYRTNGSVNKTDAVWAVKHLEDMYYLLPMVYPQLKLMAYFNKKMVSENNYYDLNGCYPLYAKFNEATESGVFIHNDYRQQAERFYKKAEDTIHIENGHLNVATYPHLYGADSIKVIYYLDGEFVHSVTHAPYELKLSGITGIHTLTVVAEGSNKTAEEKKYSIKNTVNITCADDFIDSDLLNDAQKEAVDYMVSKGIVTGYEDGTLRPQSAVTRAEFAAMTSRLMGYEAVIPCTFEDADSHWAANYIEACVRHDAINGMGNNRFQPERDITFEQAVKITTIVTGKADSTAPYPDGFIDAGLAYDMFRNMANTKQSAPLNRIDTILLMYNGVTLDLKNEEDSLPPEF